VAIDGVPKFFGYNVTASPLQAWWVISANDSNGANGYWNITLTTPMTPSALQCFGSSYPSISYKHYAGLNVPGPDMTFTSNQCVVSEQTNAVEAGTAAVGTFSGSVVQQTDSGNAPSHTLSAGSYDVIVP
jgi:hypothetical protein